MTIPPPIGWEDFKRFGVYDDDGNIVGIEEAAPDAVKKAFYAMQEKYTTAEEKNIIL